MRHADWPERLARFIEARRWTPFAYGSQDCCLFAADWILEATGEDPAAPLRGYTTKEEADARIASYGNLPALVTSFLGEPIHPAFMGRGDVGTLTVGDSTILGICTGRELAIADLKGLRFPQRAVASLAWVI